MRTFLIIAASVTLLFSSYAQDSVPGESLAYIDPPTTSERYLHLFLSEPSNNLSPDADLASPLATLVVDGVWIPDEAFEDSQRLLKNDQFRSTPLSFTLTQEGLVSSTFANNSTLSGRMDTLINNEYHPIYAYFLKDGGLKLPLFR